MFILSLKNQKEFDLVNQFGKKLYSLHFIAVIAKNFAKIASDASNVIFLGMKVGKKLGKAVVRNKIKRRIRHLIQLVSKNPQFSQEKLAIIIIPRNNFEKISFSNLLNKLEKDIASIINDRKNSA